MSDNTLTPERITQLRGLGAYQGGLLKAELDALLDAAEELHSIENRAEKPTCSRCIKVRVHSLEDERDAALAEVARLKDLPEWIIRKLKTMEYYEPPTDDRDIRSEIQGWFHVLCFHYVQNRREVKTYSENCKAMKQLEAENTKLRRWLDDAEAELERLRQAVAMEGETP